MANRDTRFLIKRSNVPGKIPTNGDLLLGELGLNTADAILYTSGTTANTILPIGWDRVARTGDTMTGGLFTPYLTATTVSATTYLNLPAFTGYYLPLSGGTVYGPTIYSSGLTANTLNVTGLTQTNGITSTGGIIFKQVTINSSYSATTQDYMIDVTGGTFTVYLPSAVGIQGRLLVVKNNGGGAVTVQPISGQFIDGKPFVILGETNTIQLVSNGSGWAAISYNISTVNSSTGVFVFTGLTIASPTTFTVAPVKGWIVNDTTNPLNPQLYYVEYSGGTHTATYVTTATETWVYLTSGGTISQTNVLLTDQQRRQNIFLGKLGHANKTSIINAFSQPDFVLSPLSQLRDMFDPIGFVNEGIRPSANGANLSFNTSAGYLHGLGINFANDTLNPNAIYVTGTSPCTFQYRTQTGGTASNTTFIDPTKYDVGGVVTSLSGTKATNQRIYLVQNGVFRVQYGQTQYSNLTQAIEGLSSEPFVEFSNFSNNGILVGILSVLSSATNLTDTSKSRFFNVSKFGDSAGAAGGSATTTLQQAYDNSVSPEIVTNSILGALSVKNGAGTADNVTNLFEGQTATNGITSIIRADGYISGTTLHTSGFTANSTGISATTVSATTIQTSSFTANSTGLSATTVSATTYLNLPTDIRVTGGTYSSGSTIFTNNTGGTFSVTGFSTGDTTLYWYAENATPPSVTPIATEIGSIALGDNAQALSSGMFVYGQNAGSNATNTANSTFMGYRAGQDATSAYFSNFIGYNSGFGAIGANDSNFIGDDAGYGAINAIQSNFIGQNTGWGATGASNSNFFGQAAGFEAIDSNTSNFIGSDAGYVATNAYDSNFIGNSAGNAAINANNSNFIGEKAGYGANNSSGSTFIGLYAGNLVLSGWNSNFIGGYAGDSSNSSSYTNFFGYESGYLSNNSIYSNFIGRGAGISATTSYNSNFIGLYAGRGASGSYYSNFIGNNAGYESSGNTYGNFIGLSAGYQSTGNTYGNFIGLNAGYQASGNVTSNFIGFSAGNKASGSTNSNFIGNASGLESISNYSNFIGYNAGYQSITTGNAYLNFIGSRAGYQSNGVGTSNFIGYQAGYLASGTSSSNIIGSSAGYQSSGNTYGNFIGTNAGYQSSGNSSSNFIGYYAGFQTNSSSNVNFIGNQAGYQSSGNSSSNFIGQNAGYGVSGSTSANFIGNQVGRGASNSDYSNFIGSSVGYSASTSQFSNFFGYYAGYLASGSSYSNMVGQYAGNGATNATYNNFFGARAGEESIGTAQSNAIGYLAGQYGSNTDYSNFIGSRAGYSSSTSTYSNFIGRDAGYTATGVTYSNFIGPGAGYGASTSSYSNLFGYQAGKAFTNNNIGSNNIIIGKNISLPNATTNAINIGGVLFGINTYTTSTGDPSIVARSTGKIGINVVTPTEALQVSGNTLIQGNLTATTVSATTYLNLPTDIRVTGASYSNNTFTYTNNTGGTFNVLFNTVTGLTVNGNLTVTGNTSMTGTLSVTGNTNVRAITGTSATLSGSGSSILTVIGSGTTTPIFTVQGSSGELFSVTDSLTGSLFSVNDISGLPIVEVFSDNTILMGNYLAPSLNTTARISLTAGTNSIYSIPTSAYTGAFVDYTVINSGNTSARAGNIMTIWNSGSTEYSEVSTNDIGSTTGITFSTALVGSNAIISASATTTGWTLKTIIRAI